MPLGGAEGLSVGDANLFKASTTFIHNVNEPFRANDAIDSLSGVDRRVGMRKSHQPAAQDVFLLLHRDAAPSLLTLRKSRE